MNTTIFVIPNLFFVFCLAALGGTVTLLTAFTKNTRSDPRRLFWHKLTTAGKWSVSCSAVLVFFIVFQDCNSKKIKQKEDEKTLIDNDKRDSTMRARIDSGVSANRKRLFGDLSEALLKQQMALDTVNNTLSRIPNTTTVILNSPKSPPVLMIDSKGVTAQTTNDTLKYTLTIKSVGGSSFIKNIHLFATLLTKDGRRIDDMPPMDYIIGGTTLADGYTMSGNFGFRLNPGVLPDTLFVALWGQYSAVGSIKFLPFREVIFYTHNSNATETFTSLRKYEFLRRYRLDKFFPPNIQKKGGNNRLPL